VRQGRRVEEGWDGRTWGIPVGWMPEKTTRGTGGGGEDGEDGASGRALLRVHVEEIRRAVGVSARKPQRARRASIGLCRAATFKRHQEWTRVQNLPYQLHSQRYIPWTTYTAH
jgi:hypothetical protein